MSEEYKITKQAILKMVEKCPEAKEALKAGFPEAFEGDEYFNLEGLGDKAGYLFTNREAQRAGFEDRGFLKILNSTDENDGKAFFLFSSPDVVWELRQVSYGQILIPTRKD